VCSQRQVGDEEEEEEEEEGGKWREVTGLETPWALVPAAALM
jgi:hypothetical protein